jgi:hypothetical protein
MVAKGLRLSVVFDSCHSGGAVRGESDAAVRGIFEAAKTPRPLESLVAPLDQLAGSWEALTRSGTRTVSGGGGWLPEPEGYVFLAACRPTELAYEFAFDGKERNGALTYWLLDTLRAHGTGVTYGMLHDRVVAKVHTQFVQQTPQLQGEGQFTFFGGDAAITVPTVPVLEVAGGGGRVRLGAGQALGTGSPRGNRPGHGGGGPPGGAHRVGAESVGG